MTRWATVNSDVKAKPMQLIYSSLPGQMTFFYNKNKQETGQ